MNYLTQPSQFDISRDFDLRETIEKKSLVSDESNNTPKQIESSLNNDTNHNDELNKMVSTLPFMNDSIRSNIKLLIEIYKQLNNFDRYYIHSIINENSTKSDK
jgi:hypothetical protein